MNRTNSNWTPKPIRPGDPTNPVVNVYSEAKTLEYFKLAEEKAASAQGAVNGLCRFCSKPRPPGYSVTCADSHCQQRAYEEAPRGRRQRRRK